MSLRILHGDCLALLPTLDADSLDACVTDPPYGLSFMDRAWDHPDNIAFRPATWAAVLRVLRPGAHLVAFAGTRTGHRLACAIEDGGFQIRDCLAWVTGSGFPKSRNLDGDWQGWGTALKPAWEMIYLARKPLAEGTVAANVLRHGTGALNIDGCRVASQPRTTHARGNIQGTHAAPMDWGATTGHETNGASARWPANLVHDGSAEVLAEFAKYGESVSKSGGSRGASQIWGGAHGKQSRGGVDDTGSAARFFASFPSRFYYTSKADAADRLSSKHPTIKPVSLCRWLVRLVCPPGGTVLDCFAGSGTTGMACLAEGFDAVLVEREAEYVKDIHHRVKHVHGHDTPLFAAVAKAQGSLL